MNDVPNTTLIVSPLDLLRLARNELIRSDEASLGSLERITGLRLATQLLLEAIAVMSADETTGPLPPVVPRAPFDDDKPDGLRESDRDYVEKNMDVAVLLLDRAAAQQMEPPPADLCPNCGKREVGTFNADVWFLYGVANPIALLARDVEFFRCMACSLEYTGEDGEIKRMQAVRDYLASRGPTQKASGCTVIRRACSDPKGGPEGQNVP